MPSEGKKMPPWLRQFLDMYTGSAVCAVWTDGGTKAVIEVTEPGWLHNLEWLLLRGVRRQGGLDPWAGSSDGWKSRRFW